MTWHIMSKGVACGNTICNISFFVIRYLAIAGGMPFYRQIHANNLEICTKNNKFLQ